MSDPPALPDGLQARPATVTTWRTSSPSAGQDAFADIGNQPPRHPPVRARGMRVEDRFDFWVKRLG